MKLKCREGSELLFMPGNHWENLTNTLIVNFNDKYIYEYYKIHKNQLILFTSKGCIVLVFTGETPKVCFESYEKDQVIFKLKNV